MGKLDDRRVTGDQITPDTRLSELCELWVTTHDVAAGSRDTYRAALDRHIIPRLGSLRLREITASRADAFIRGVAEKRTITVDGRTVQVGGPTVAKQARTVLSMVLGMAARYDAVPANVVGSTTVPKVRRSPVQAMPPEDVHALREHLKTWAAGKQSGPRRNPAVVDLLDVLAGTGLRPGELLALRWQDVDFKASTLTVDGTVKRVKDTGLIRQDYPKSERSQRTVTVPTFVMDALRHRRSESPNVFPAGLVFPNRDGGLWEPSNVERLWRAARAGGFEHVTFRALRKAVATLLERELGMAAAQEQLGHSSPDVTRRHYVQRRDVVDVSSPLRAMRSS
nr:site-specific integrase [Kocuria indica]